MAALGWLVNLGFAGGGAAAVVTPEPLRECGGVSRARHIPWEPVYPEHRPLTQAEERELVRLVKRAIDEDDQKAKERLEALARKYRDFENSLASFSQAFQAMSEINHKRFESHRISALKYKAEQHEIEEEETIILQILKSFH